MLSNKPKSKVKRDRSYNVAVRKKSRLEPVKSEGANAELRKDIFRLKQRQFLSFL